MDNPTLPAIPGVRLTPISLEIDDASPDTLRALGRSLAELEKSRQWWWGDWARRWGALFGQLAAEIEALTGMRYQTLANLAWVAGRFEPSRRREDLSWWHHAECASLDPADADRLLERAASEGWSGRQMREAVRRIKGIPEPPAIDIPELNKRIAAQLRHLRAVAGISQEALAEEVYGTPEQQGTISRLERGVQRPNLGTLTKLSEWSGAPVESFGVPSRPMLPARLVQRHAKAALAALDRGETTRLRAILERMATAVEEGDL